MTVAMFMSVGVWQPVRGTSEILMGPTLGYMDDKLAMGWVRCDRTMDKFWRVVIGMQRF